MEAKDWVPVAGQGGVVVLVLWWFGKYLVPKLMERNDQLVAAFQTEAKSEREAHLQAVSELREHDAAMRDKTHELLAEQTSEIHNLTLAIARSPALRGVN